VKDRGTAPPLRNPFKQSSYQLSYTLMQLNLFKCDSDAMSEYDEFTRCSNLAVSEPHLVVFGFPFM
jgi:hypothetical protein